MSSPRISVVVTAHNYGKYLPQCLDSVFEQNCSDWELVVVNDGSTDDTPAILESYQKKMGDKIKVVTLTGVGLAKACNTGIRASRGEYIVRLDADDYFDESILLVESTILDKDPSIHMVYPDYYRINKYGEILDSYRLQKVNDEVKLLDRSPLAAGAMYRRTCYDEIGGYNEKLRYQEDYDFWIKFIDKFKVYNVNLPLMYYRKHDASMSTNFTARMKARQSVKQEFVHSKNFHEGKNVIVFIPAMGRFRGRERLALRSLNGKPLISYVIKQAMLTDMVKRVVVSTEDPEIAEVALEEGAEVPYLRPVELAKTSVTFTELLRHFIQEMKNYNEDVPDYIVILNYNNPFTEARHITEAINTILLYGTDSVISVTTDLSFHWMPGKDGLSPVGYKKRLLKEDKDTVYKETGAIYVLKTSNIYGSDYLGESVGNIEMATDEAWKIENEFDFWVAEQISANHNDQEN